MIKLFSFVSFCLFASVALGKKFEVPSLSGPIIDEMNVLQPHHREELDRILRVFNQQKVAQVQIYITRSLQGLPVEKASIDIVDQWRLGDKEKDNGLLFLIAPEERKMRIEVGQGLEGIIPDIYAKKISEDIVVPFFKSGDMSSGIYNGTHAILSLLAGENLDKLKSISPVRESKDISFPDWIIIVIWLLLIFFGKLGRYGRGSSWNGGYYGGGGGSSGGGGWSGGGGGFSGGGSSSSW